MTIIERLKGTWQHRNVEPNRTHRHRPDCFHDESSQGAFLRSFDGRVIPLRKSSLLRRSR